MKIKICLLLVVWCALMALTPSKILAGDYADLHFIGFSRDGKYLAFEQYGTADGSGYPYAYLYLVDAEKNTFASKPFEVYLENERATEEDAVKKVEALAARKMRQLKIERGNTGKLILAHPLTDETLDLPQVSDDEKFSKVRFKVRPYPMEQSGFIELKLNSIPVKPANCDDDSGVYEFFKFELTLDSLDGDGEKRIETEILQKDIILPPQRGCPTSYRQERVYLYKDKLAVFINMFSRGYEGDNMRYMVVTGKLPQYF